MAAQLDLTGLTPLPDDEPAGALVHVDGIVQGVGFRPFVYGLARRYQLTGWVRNTSGGVDIHAEGCGEALRQFVTALTGEAPPLAHIAGLKAEAASARGYEIFEILRSEEVEGAFQPVSPDVSLCEDCRRELFDPGDRRYRYPFINCTNCGPRFTIIRDLPYDRPKTTMAGFELCAECRQEYEDPADRRFHAQPVACPICGPQTWLEINGTVRFAREAAIHATRDLLLQGRILAVKGLGGFHLACDATNGAAVARLRARKGRAAKPFALMMPDLATIRRHCAVSAAEAELLASRERPIVLLARKESSAIAIEAAPGQATLGVMLPYTPLHELLLEPEPGFPPALVMTSGNRTGEPIAVTNEAGRSQLAAIADGFLLHDRPIQTRCDDSVARSFRQRPISLRRARGYAPHPIALPRPLPPVLAAGGELKNTFCLTRDRSAFLGQHVGNLRNFETLEAYQAAINNLEDLLRTDPEVLAFDLHPDYLATRYAQERSQLEGLPTIGVQHHHAHIAACLAEHGYAQDEPVIGLAFDGTGYGPDGAVWGGEVLLADYEGYQRAYHLRYVPLPGGDAAVREPWRMALTWLREANLEWSSDLPPVAYASFQARAILERQLDLKLNAPSTSSLGRLFDAVASLIGIRHVITFEAQAAMELEAKLDPSERGAYPFTLEPGTIDPRPALHALVADLRRGAEPGVMSARFHNGLADLALELCSTLRGQNGLETVALSGGVWQNMALLTRTVIALEAAGFTVLWHEKVPANDGGLSLGQAMVAGRVFAAGGPQMVSSPRLEFEG